MNFHLTASTRPVAKKTPAPAQVPASKPQQKPPAKKETSIEDLFGGVTATSPPVKKGTAPAKPSSSTNLIDDLFGAAPSTTPVRSSSSTSSYSGFSAFSSETPKRSLLKHVVGGGLGIEYSYVRAPSMIGATVNTLQLWFKNHSQKPIQNIRVGKTVRLWFVVPALIFIDFD